MSSVVDLAADARQPYGGYVHPADFSETRFDQDGHELYEENVQPSVVGRAVECLSLFLAGETAGNAFRDCMLGASAAEGMHGSLHIKDAVHEAEQLLSRIEGDDDRSVRAACRLAGYAVYYESPSAARRQKKPRDINPDGNTVSNIRVMARRGEAFWKTYGLPVRSGVRLPESVHTKHVDEGIVPHMTATAIWDFRVVKNRLLSKNTLEFAMLYLMGLHAGDPAFSGVRTIGLFNPRLGTALSMDVSDIPRDVLRSIERDVMGYGTSVLPEDAVPAAGVPDAPEPEVEPAPEATPVAPEEPEADAGEPAPEPKRKRHVENPVEDVENVTLLRATSMPVPGNKATWSEIERVRVGSRVVHRTVGGAKPFGDGVVREIGGGIVTVEFAGAGKRRFIYPKAFSDGFLQPV